MGNNPVSIKILDQSYKVNCPVGEENNLLELAAQLNQKLVLAKSRTPANSITQLLVMVALEISYEAKQQSILHLQQAKQVDERIESMQKALANALIKGVENQDSSAP